MTITEVMDSYLSVNEIALTSGTISYYKSQICAIKPYFADKDIKTFTRKDVNDFLLSCKDKVKNNTLNKYLTTIKTLIRHVLSERPFSISESLNDEYNRILAMRKAKADTTSYIAVPEQNYQDMVNYINDESYDGKKGGMRHLTKLRNRFILEMCLHTGVRRTEMINIKYEDVLFEHHCIRLRHTKANGERMLPLTPVMEVLLKMMHDLRPTDYVLYNYHYSQPLTEDGINTIFNKDLAKVLGFRITSHMCRHTFATNAVNHDMNPVSLMQLMGHKDLKTTMIYYQKNQSKIIQDGLNCIQY